jgi:ubiquinone/menaquinone biosynthesis C-methylase UbiE
VAATWDEKPARVKMAGDVGDAIAKQIDFTPDMDIMDFGCGTGLISLRFHSQVRTITGFDSSQGMLDVFNQKAAQAGWDNVRGVLVDLDQGDQLEGQYDVILSSMTMHHIRDIKSLLEQFYRILNPDGYLCIADLDREDGTFHEDKTGIFHFGFDRGNLRQIFTAVGFEDVQVADAAEMFKESADGEMRRFSIFSISGRKTISPMEGV